MKDLGAWLHILSVDGKPDMLENVEMTASVVVPNHLLNAFNRAKNILPNKKSSPLLYCSWAMCDIELWQALYLCRNSNSSLPILPDNAVQASPHRPSPLKKEPKGKKKLSVSLSDCEESPSPMHMTSFNYGDSLNATLSAVKNGRNYDFEVKFVERLMSLSADTNSFGNNHPPVVPVSHVLSNHEDNHSHSPNAAGVASQTRHNPFIR